MAAVATWLGAEPPCHIVVDMETGDASVMTGSGCRIASVPAQLLETLRNSCGRDDRGSVSVVGSACVIELD